MNHDLHVGRAADQAARHGYGKLIAFLAARSGDIAGAEDALAEAFAAALLDWEGRGIPSNPEAWLLTTARRKLIDAARRKQNGTAATEQLRVLNSAFATANDPMAIPDRRLALMFTCAHPAIAAEVRAPLMLQGVLGLDAKTIGSAFLVSPDAMGKRLSRAKTKIRHAGVPFQIPGRDALAERLGAVLDAVYAAYGEGWGDPTDADKVRRDLSDEALFLAGLVCELAPEEPEALGLLALMLYAHARRHARRAPDGRYVPLAEQSPILWDSAMIGQAETLLLRAKGQGQIGRYQLEAALQSAHVHRCRTGHDNWAEVVQLYDALTSLSPSPVVAINRAVAVAEAQGAVAGLAALPQIDDDVRLADYQPYWAARAQLMARTGDHAGARQAYNLAIGLERDAAVRAFLQERLARVTDDG